MKYTCVGNKFIKRAKIDFGCAEGKDGQQAPNWMTGRKLQGRFPRCNVACNEMCPGDGRGKEVNQ